jgi:hypothetical protein
LRKGPIEKSKLPTAELREAGILSPMNFEIRRLACKLGPLSVVVFATALATASETNSLETPDSSTPATGRYGLFNGLDHRSWYSEGDFPEPFLVDDTGLEINEARLDWLHSETADSQSDVAAVEVEKGFGVATLELKVPYERDSSSGGTLRGVGNIEVGARQPFYQYVSEKGFFDTTAGAALEVGIPVNSAVSKNTELVPKLFNDLRIGEKFTLQSLFGYSTLFGGGADGGLQVFEYGFVFGYFIPHSVLPLPGVQRLVPMFELQGETQMNHEDPGRNSLVGNAAFRVNLNNIGRVQPRLGVGFVFPIDNNAREDLQWGIFTSLVFEY